MSDRTPLPIPDEVVGQARRIALALQPEIENLVIRALTGTYRAGWADGYLARPVDLDAESPTPET